MRATKPYKMKLRHILFLKGGLKLWNIQRVRTREHLQQESEQGFRLVALGDGHFMGYRPWCDTKLYHCPDLPGVMFCMCQHGESREAATRERL